ncbi:MAG: hypothetical protein AAF990_10255 [Bacteroidota bacterium]
MKLRLLTIISLLFFGLIPLGATSGSNGGPGGPGLIKRHLSLKKDFSVPVDSMGWMEEESVRVPVKKSDDGFLFPEIEDYLMSQAEGPMEAPQGLNNNTDPMTDILGQLGDGTYSEKVKEAKQVIEKAIEVGNFLTTLTGANLEKATLPIVIKKTIGNVTAYMVINRIVLKPQYAELDVFVGMRIPSKNSSVTASVDIKGIPGDGLVLMFAASGIKFSSSAGIVGDATVGLLSTVAFEIGGSNKKTAVVLRPWYEHEAPPGSFSGDYGTFITIDCDGVKEFGVEADVYFSRDWMLPLDANGDILQGETDRVNGHIQVLVQDWNNLLLENISITSFVLTRFQDMSFTLTNANVDLSDYRNPSTLTFPAGYQHGLPPNNLSLWRGVYIEHIELTLPSPFKRKCSGYGMEEDIPELDKSLERRGDPLQWEQEQAFDAYASADVFGTSGGPSAGGYDLRPTSEDVELTMANNTCRIKVGAENLLIDETGVSGLFYIEGEVPLLSSGLMDNSWGWSLDYIEVGLLQSKVDQFGFGGMIAVPILKETTPLGYEAHINFPDPASDNYEYMFAVTLEDDLQFPLWNAAQVNLMGGSQIIIEGEIGPNGKVVEFLPTANLSGSLAIGKPSDYVNNPNGPDVKIAEVTFNHLILQTQQPYLSLDPDQGSIGISSDLNSKVLNFPVSLNNFELTSLENGTKASLGMTIGLDLMSPDDGGLQASGGFRIIGKLVIDGNGAHKWKFDKLEFDGAHIALNLPSFKAEGTINLFRDDPTYGDGFSGVLCARIMGDNNGTPACQDNSGKFKLDMAAIFGAKNNYRYWLVDAYVSGSAINVPIPPTPLVLNGFGGGAFHHMKPVGYQDPSSGPPLGVGVDASGIIYEPTPTTKLGLKFAVGLTNTPGNTFQGKLTCILRFGPNISLQNITFWGVGEIINNVAGDTDPASRVETVAQNESQMQNADAQSTQNASNEIKFKLGLSLDFENGFSFHGYADVNINQPSAGLTGSGTLDLLIDPGNNRWHLFIGGYRDGSVQVPSFWNPQASISLYPVSVSLQYWGQTFTADVYFLTGNDIPGPPPLHPEAAAYFGESVATNRGDLNGSCPGSTVAMGTGFAFGASLFFKFEKKIKKKILFAKITVLKVKVSGGVGFDLSFLKYDPNAVCQNGTSPHGVNGFRATGRIWAFVDARGKVLGIPLPTIGVGVKLEADIVKPSYFDATVVINFIKKWRFSLDLGDKCGVLCN